MFRHILKAAALCLLLLPNAMTAQTKKTFTLDDLMWGGSNYWNLMPRSHFAAWWGDCLVENVSDAVKQITDAKGRTLKTPVTLFTESDVRAALDQAKHGQLHGTGSASFPEAGSPIVQLNTSKGIVRYNWQTRTVTAFVPTERGTQASKMAANMAIAFVKDYNVYVTTPDGTTRQVSHDGNRELQYGLSVHRDEFGIHEGLFWSPKGSLLAFYRMDQTMVTDFPLVDNSPRVATLAPEKYPMAGMTSHKVSVGIYNPATGRTVYLKTADPTDRYFTNIAWSPDEKTVYMFELPRTQDKAELIRYDAATGDCLGTLYTETNARYVEPMHPIVFLPWDATHYIMQSRRDGYNHLYLCSVNGGEPVQLTRGEYEVTEMVGFNAAKRSIVYVSNEGSPIERHIFSVSVKDGKRQRLSADGGSHRPSLSAGGTYVCDTWSNPGMYRRYDLLNTAKAGSAQTLWQLPNPWQDYDVPQVKNGTIKAADGKTDLYYRMVLPTNFDANKKYPAVVYVYGGPHAHNVEASWMYMTRPWEIYMAQRGYVIFVVDNRGSEDRGFAFESVTHRHLGDTEMADQMEGVKFLKQQPFVDADRLGVHGWSFGGFMTTNLMCSYPDVFKVGVAGGPVIDWKFYEVMYGERYMDTPQENPEGYKSSSLLNKAKNLKGRLQIIVGYNDPTCVLQHSLSFLRACEDAGTQPDYFVYPGQGHNMMGRDMVHLHDRITRYFDDYLKGER